MNRPLGFVLLFAALVVLCASSPSLGFTTLPVFNNGTDDPADDLQDAGRWSDVSGTFASENVRGLGGGLEYAVAQDFYDRILPSFVDGSTRDQVYQAIRRSFDKWASGSPLSFVDISARIPAIRDAASPGSGTEIDIFAVSGNSIDFVGNPLSGNTVQQFTSADPMGTNGRTLSGWTITSADILINYDRQYYLDPNNPQVQQLQGQGQFLVHFESLILHEIGHAIGLEHPDVWWTRNFDTDSNANNSMNINCNNPTQGLSVQTNFNRNAVMTAENSHTVRLNLTGDDIGGRNFLYPSCSGGGGSSPPPPPPPPADEPPSTPPPPVTPPPPTSGGSDLASYDANGSCVLEEAEFFNLVDGWIGGSVDNGLFFAGVDAWIGQTNICNAAIALSSVIELQRLSDGVIGFSLNHASLNINQVEIYALNGQHVFSAQGAGNSLYWTFGSHPERQVPNGVYVAVIEVEDQTTHVRTHLVVKVAVLR